MKSKEKELGTEEAKIKCVYLLSPVRNVTEDQAEVIAKHAKSLDVPGIRLFNPIEDAPQQDATGYNIVMAELNFLFEAANNGGKVDVLWNLGGTPSEGSRVDVGMAISLGLPINLVDIFNADSPTGPQKCFSLLKGEVSETEIAKELLERIKESKEVVVDWDMEMKSDEQEWQRIYLGLALGQIVQNPEIKIRLGNLVGIDPPEKKSYVKVIREIEKRQNLES